MYDKKLKEIFTIENLKKAKDSINTKSIGIDNKTLENIDLKKLQLEVLSFKYIPEPLKKFEIKKENNKTRPLSIASLKDKIVQKVLADELDYYFDKKFSNKNYGYRKNKGTLKAINRVKDYLKRGYFCIYKSDIDNFFESIDHNILLNILHLELNKEIIKLISLFIKNGLFKQFEYLSHEIGVHQGDILSPLLSNIYLNQMDKFLEREEIEFVRFADDFVLFFRNCNEAEEKITKLQKFLKTISLNLNKDKSYFANIKKGFDFLGIYFQNKELKIENKRFNKQLLSLHKLSKEKLTFKEYICKLKQKIDGLNRYYFKIINKNSTQYKIFKKHLIDTISIKVSYALHQEKLTKSQIKTILDILELNRDEYHQIMSLSYDKYLEFKKDTKTKLKKKKQEYTKKLSLSSIITINSYGIFVGISKNQLTLKKGGKVIKNIPISQISTILINSKGVSFSSTLIYLCAKKGISIEFIDNNYNPYASIISNTQAYSNITLLQIESLKHKLYLSKQFIKGKLKNQLNLLKYFNKYHKNLNSEIKNIEKNIIKLNKATKIETILGIEGNIAQIYWQGFKKIIEKNIEFEGRIKKGATDLVNSMLNYGYAILYHKIQEYLIKAGFNLTISYLHNAENKKPSLVFDMIEEFRFIVDRVVISIINKNEPIKLDKDFLLTNETKNILIKHITEKLATYQPYHSKNLKLEDIIKSQVYLLLKHIKNEENYKPFIRRF